MQDVMVLLTTLQTEVSESYQGSKASEFKARMGNLARPCNRFEVFKDWGYSSVVEWLPRMRES